ncbi:cysteinyl-tRNA synthetase [Gracilibacillus boraciitolerans JCM 21714]|uniref:Cysteine--tRNA ligase n=1 Tax=Gracilibacillus boraciitolerans JCM 21714 TaxID=1298598 RepID=W4VLS4_9BACI|nr:cysteinyl-tRNA synthetase [Gracilibacillus boraciitolerans JCM 21714]
MARKYLGDTIDIHAGGQDLTFPHHENEIAQSEAGNGTSFANYWMHNGYINIDNEKMSKSLGNFVLAHELIKKHDPKVVRFFMLSVHYRHPINFNDSLLDSAKNSYDRIENALTNLNHRKEASVNLATDNHKWLAEIEKLNQQFEKEMDDDFNTANAIAVMFDLVKEANLYLNEDHTHTEVIDAFLKTLTNWLDVLGIPRIAEQELLDDEIDALIQKRIDARKNKEFATADQIREDLKARNIILEDTPQGTRWKRGG